MSLSRKSRLETILIDHFSPSFLDVINESFMHRVPENAETHFKITVVSEAFIGQTPVSRQKMVYFRVKEEWEQGLHALSMHLYTPEQWAKQQQILSSPLCAHQKASHDHAIA